MPPHKLSAEERQAIRVAVAGLTGKERHREYMRLRSHALRRNESYRAADNAKQAERGRERYHADLEAGRRKGVEKWRRRAQIKQETGARSKSPDAQREIKNGS